MAEWQEIPESMKRESRLLFFFVLFNLNLTRQVIKNTFLLTMAWQKTKPLEGG